MFLSGILVLSQSQCPRELNHVFLTSASTLSIAKTPKCFSSYLPQMLADFDNTWYTVLWINSSKTIVFYQQTDWRFCSLPWPSSVIVRLSVTNWAAHYNSRTVWPKITKFYSDIHADLGYSLTGYDIGSVDLSHFSKVILKTSWAKLGKDVALAKLKSNVLIIRVSRFDL